MSISISRSPSVSAIGAQPLDAELTALAGLTSAANKMSVWTGSGTAQIESFQDWTTYTPTFANTTLGSGAVGGRYQQVGKYVAFIAFFTLGSGSAVSGLVTVTLPVTSVNYSVSGIGTAGNRPIGHTAYLAAGANSYGIAAWQTTTTATLYTLNTAGTSIARANTSSSLPGTWTSGDEIFVQGFYEANAV